MIIIVLKQIHILGGHIEVFKRWMFMKIFILCFFFKLNWERTRGHDLILPVLKE